MSFLVPRYRLAFELSGEYPFSSSLLHVFMYRERVSSRSEGLLHMCFDGEQYIAQVGVIRTSHELGGFAGHVSNHGSLFDGWV